MRVLFAVPRSYNPKQMYREYPLGVGYLATVLEAQGHAVRIFDQNVEGQEDGLLFDLVAQFQPGIVGFSVITPNYPVARRQIRRLRQEHPGVHIIAGGVHANLFPDDLIADGVDAVVLGEAEPGIAELVCSLQEGRPLGGLAGLVFRDPAGQAVRTPGGPSVARLDQVPVIKRSLYHLERYSHHSMMASRGCPFHCAFCCNYTGTVRQNGVGIRGPEPVLAEMIHLRDQYGAREIFFADDLFLVRKKDILEFCRAYIERRAGVEWIGQMRADRVDEEVGAAMALAGCRRVYFGVESGSDKILSSANKGMNRDQIRLGVRAAQKAGLRVKTGWIFGLPGPLEEQYESIPFMLDLRPHEISIHQLIPFPGTIYYEDPARFGIRIADPKSFESFCYGGLDGNIRFDYLSQSELVRLLEDTAKALEDAGYVSSDEARPDSDFIYTTPLNRHSMNVFRPREGE
jgi:radical SAM superfamily enzyme YgiQ (UPF0313 family)